MKLGDIFKKPQIDDEDGSNPRALSSKMNFKFRRPPVQGAFSGAVRPFIPDWIPNNPSFVGQAGIACPENFLYRYTPARQIQGTNVPSYIYLGANSDSSSSVSFLSLWIKNWGVLSTNPFSGAQQSNTAPGTGIYTGHVPVTAGGAFGPSGPWNAILGAQPILVNTFQWISFGFQIIQQFPGLVKTIRLYASKEALDTSTESALFDAEGQPLFTEFGFFNVTGPTGCTTPPALVTNSPDWGSTQSSYF